MRAIACVSRAAEGLVGLPAHIDVGRSPFPNIAALFEFAAFARRLPFVDDRQPSTNPAAIRCSVVEIHQDDGIVIFTLGITAVAPIVRRRVTRSQNEFEILAVGDFAGIKRCRSEEIYREKENPEVTQSVCISRFKTSHRYPLT